MSSNVTAISIDVSFVKFETAEKFDYLGGQVFPFTSDLRVIFNSTESIYVYNIQYIIYCTVLVL